MKNKMLLMAGRCGLALLLIGSALLSTAARASCTILDRKPAARIGFAPPTLIVNSDAEPGTIIYSERQSSYTIRVECTAVADIWQGYTNVNATDERADNPLQGVYQTNVPGIGFRAAWTNATTPTFEADDIVRPWHKDMSPVIKENGYYTLTLNGAAQFVVTGPVSSGMVYIGKFNAEWKYDNTVVGYLSYSSSLVEVQHTTCNLVEKNITVPLEEINASEFTNNVSRVVSDDRFKLQIDNCDAGRKNDYRFTTAGSTGVTNGNILNIAAEEGAAQGVGIQILNSNNAVLQFDQEYTAVSQTSAGQSVTIPLKARYIKTGTVKGGHVNAAATFEVYYR